MAAKDASELVEQARVGDIEAHGHRGHHAGDVLVVDDHLLELAVERLDHAARLDPARAVGFNPGVLLLYPLFVGLAVAGPAFALRTLFTRSRPCAPPPRSS